MRICVISSTVFPVPLVRYGGLEQIALHCADGLARLGHSVVLVAPDGSRCDGVQVLHTGPPGAHSEQQAYDRYWKFLPGCDVIIDHSWQKNAYLLKMEGRLPAPVLGVWHAPVLGMFQTLPSVEKLCTVLISDDQRAHYEALHSRPGRTCYNGVDLNYYRPMTVKRNGRALFCARFSAIKGADLAIDACAKLGVGLDLVGDTTITNEPEYFAQCKSRCDGTGVAMVGPETRGGTVLRYSQADVFLHPNMRFREPFGLAPVEAQACGLPVIAWDHGAMRETVKHGETGFLVRNEAEFLESLRLVRDMGVSDATRARCREWAARFSVENMALRYQELCHEALQTGGW